MYKNLTYLVVRTVPAAIDMYMFEKWSNAISKKFLSFEKSSGTLLNMVGICYSKQVLANQNCIFNYC